MNLFASRPFLEAIARTYFPSHDWRVEDYGIGGRLFRLLTIDGCPPVTRHPFLDMHEPVANADAPARSRIRWLPNVNHDLVELAEFRNNAAWRRFSAAPTIRWQHFRTWECYLDLLRGRHLLRDDQRRQRRVEELAGPLTFAADDPAPDVLPTAFAWKSAQWRRMAVIDLFADPRHRAFFDELRSCGLLRASTLRARGRLLAAWLGAVFDRRWYGWIFAFDPDPALAKYSVGRQLLYPMLEESYRSGHTEFDFSNGCEPYKLFFATHVRTIGPLGPLPVRYRVKSMLRDRLRHAPRVYGRMKALRLAVEREMFKVRCTLRPRYLP